MRWLKNRVYLLLAGTLLLTLSCAPKITGLYHDASFTHQSIISSEMAVGGVTSSEDDLSIEQAQKYSSILRERFEATEGAGQSFTKEDVMANSLDDDQRKKIINEYKNNGTLGDSSIGLLKSKVRNITYLIFARIEDNDFWTKRTRHNIYRYQRSYYRKRPVKVLVGVDRYYRAYRSMTVTLSLYDLDKGKLAWSGTLTNYLRNAVRDSDRWGLLRFSFFSYPKPPETKEVLELIFDGFAKNFAKPAKNK